MDALQHVQKFNKILSTEGFQNWEFEKKQNILVKPDFFEQPRSEYMVHFTKKYHRSLNSIWKWKYRGTRTGWIMVNFLLAKKPVSVITQAFDCFKGCCHRLHKYFHPSKSCQNLVFFPKKRHSQRTFKICYLENANANVASEVRSVAVAVFGLADNCSWQFWNS